MKLRQLLPATAVLLVAQTARGQNTDNAPARTEETTCFGGERMDMVNARYEPCIGNMELSYLRVVTPMPIGYSVRIVGADGCPRMEGSSSDAFGQVPHGLYQYYDGAGALRSEGHYTNGVKSGTWHRYSEQGLVMADREYDGLAWDQREVLLGLTSISGIE